MATVVLGPPAVAALVELGELVVGPGLAVLSPVHAAAMSPAARTTMRSLGARIPTVWPTTPVTGRVPEPLHADLVLATSS